jgi:hypothetical protein
MIFSFSRKVILPIFLLGMSISLDISAVTLTKEGTFYSDSFDWGQTANGDIFDQKSYSAAICDIPLGQYLYASKWWKGIVINANDRPNCNRYPNVIDLSREAFRILAPLESGRISGVQVTPLGAVPSSTKKWFLAKNSFEHLGVTLTSDIPTILFTGEGIMIEGTTDEISDYVIVYIAREDWGFSESQLVKVSRNNTFKAQISLPKISWEYTFIIARGKSFNTDKYAALSLIDGSSLVYPTIPTVRYKFTPKISISDWVSYISIPEKITAELMIRQWESIFETKGKSLLFSGIKLKPGIASAEMSGYTLSTSSPLDRSARIPSFFSGSVILDYKREPVGQENMNLRIQKNIANIRFTVPKDTKLRSKYYFTLPDGSVKEQLFPSEYVGSDSTLISGSLIQIQVSLPFKWTYVFEVVRQDGIAFINTPILPSFSDSEIRTIRKNKDIVILSTQERINTLRESLKIPKVSLDPILTKLAQAKVDDMIARSYQAHADPDGLYIDWLAQKLWLYTNTALAENIGYGNISDLALQKGLEESGSHRYTILSHEFSKVGIGYGIKGDKVYLVHVFGE